MKRIILLIVCAVLIFVNIPASSQDRFLFCQKFLDKSRDETAFRKTGEAFCRYSHDLAHVGWL